MSDHVTCTVERDRMERMRNELEIAHLRISRLREYLLAAGRNAGCLLADDVSDEFLRHVPGEVKVAIEKAKESTQE